MTKAKAAAARNPSDPPAKDELTQALLDATIEVVGESGYSGARVVDIAARAGLTTGAVYTRFSGKEELLLAAFDQVSGHRLQALARSNVPASGIFAVMGTDVITNDDSRASSLLLESFAAARRDSEVSSRLRSWLADERGHLAQLVDEEKSSGAMDQRIDTTSIVVFAQAVGIGTQFLRLIEPNMPSVENWGQLLRRVIASAATDSLANSGPTD